ncbi:vesicle-associated membrane protein 8 [Crotalus adamanteus]|uniref:Vesicle-associated membrane protein 8 n=1 Tax=Crotalus adamanteus TaxID=8729 RepID=A0AAW1B026_CROAD
MKPGRKRAAAPVRFCSAHLPPALVSVHGTRAALSRPGRAEPRLDPPKATCEEVTARPEEEVGRPGGPPSIGKWPRLSRLERDATAMVSPVLGGGEGRCPGGLPAIAPASGTGGGAAIGPDATRAGRPPPARGVAARCPGARKPGAFPAWGSGTPGRPPRAGQGQGREGRGGPGGGIRGLSASPQNGFRKKLRLRALPAPPRFEGGNGSGPGMANDRVKNLQNEVEGVKNIMTQNVERILARGENLDHLRNKTEDLEATSEHFKTTSQKVARKYWWKNIKMIAIICIIAVIILILIILLATGVIPS